MTDASLAGGNPAPFRLWSLRDDVVVESEPGQPVVVRSRYGDTNIGRQRPAVLAALRRMSLGPIALSNVIHDQVDRSSLDDALARLEHLVVWSVALDPERPLLSMVPMTPQSRARWPGTALVRPVRLSRFAMLRTDGANFLMESPLSLHRVVLHQAEAVARVGALIRPKSPDSLDAVTLVLVTHLIAAGLVVEAVSNGPLRPLAFAEDTDPALAGWSAVDLMFHTRSTVGRHDDDFGATYPMGEDWPSAPVVKPRVPAPAVALPRPEWKRLVTADVPLCVAVEARQDSHRQGPEPVTAAQLGELLYRTARLRSLVGTDPGNGAEPGVTVAGSDRPYPSIGDCYELELYVAVDRCHGVRRGVYHYDPLGHRLEPLEATAADLAELLSIGQVAANLTTTPAVSFTITARFQRVSWRYSGLTYAAVLVDVGALTKLLGLTSAAIGLAGRRVDGGELEASPRILGLDWRVESSVGGFVLGRPDPDARPGGANGRTRAVNDADWPARARAALATTRGRLRSSRLRSRSGSRPPGCARSAW